MRRPPREDIAQRRPRSFPPPIATLGQIHASPGWFWLCCNNGLLCTHRRKVALAQFVIRYGADASTDIIRKRAVCTACGSKGGTLMTPSWEERLRERFECRMVDGRPEVRLARASPEGSTH